MTVDDANQGPRRPARRRSRAKVVVVALVVVVAAAGSVIAYRLDRSRGSGSAGSPTDSTSTFTVTRRTLSVQTTVDGTLGYAGSYTVVNELGGSTGASSTSVPASAESSARTATLADDPMNTTASPTPSGTPTTATPTPTPRTSAPSSARPTTAPPTTGRSPASGQPTGTSPSGQSIVTALPAVGQVIAQGQVLYRVSGTPVVLLYGSIPAYRNLQEGATGTDVTELNADLVALGDATTSELSPTSDEFGSATRAAVERLQEQLGVDQTGVLDLGQAVFLPSEARITTVHATLGAPITAGTTVVEATSTTRQVTVNLDTSDQSDVSVGDDVTITLPNNQTTPGRVSTVGTVATSPGSGSSGSSPASASSSAQDTVEVDVTPLDANATGQWDEAPVQVDITTGQAPNALVVPVDALRAEPGGGYAVEVVDADGGRHQVSVSLGLFDDTDGLVQVTDTRLQAGQRVVVPGQ